MSETVTMTLTEFVTERIAWDLANGEPRLGMVGPGLRDLCLEVSAVSQMPLYGQAALGGASAESTLRTLAALWQYHPDYRPEWRS